MKKLLFFSGPHGSGKTTLINSILKDYENFMENDFDINFLKNFNSISVMNDFERCLLRLYHRMFVANYAEQFSHKSKETILVSRSVYDSFAYIDTYYQLGKISEYEYSIFQKIKNSLPMLPNTVILNPDVDVIMSRLEKRRVNNERPERDITFRSEDTEEFVRLLHDNFEKYGDNKNVLYIKDNSIEDIKKIEEWVCENECI